MNTNEIILNYSLSNAERIKAINIEEDVSKLDFLITRDDSLEIKKSAINRVFVLMKLNIIKNDNIFINALKYNTSSEVQYLVAQYATNIKELNEKKLKTNDKKLIRLIDLRIKDLYLLDEYFYVKNHNRNERLFALNKFNLPSGLIEVSFIFDDDLFAANIVNLICNIDVKSKNYFDAFTTKDIDEIIHDLSLNSSMWRIRSKATIKMNEFGFPLSVEHAVLNDKDFRVRLSLLSYIKDRKGFSLLVALSDENPKVRREATKLLTDKGDVKQVYEKEKFGRNKFYAKYLLLCN